MPWITGSLVQYFWLLTALRYGEKCIQSNYRASTHVPRAHATSSQQHSKIPRNVPPAAQDSAHVPYTFFLWCVPRGEAWIRGTSHFPVTLPKAPIPRTRSLASWLLGLGYLPFVLVCPNLGRGVRWASVRAEGQQMLFLHPCGWTKSQG